jgi:hypothetical protein
MATGVVAATPSPAARGVMMGGGMSLRVNNGGQTGIVAAHWRTSMHDDPAPTLDLNAIEARIPPFSEPPWTWRNPCGTTYSDLVDAHGACVLAPSEDLEDRVLSIEVGYKADEFIAHAREDIPALVARVRALEAYIEQRRIDDQHEAWEYREREEMAHDE